MTDSAEGHENHLPAADLLEECLRSELFISCAESLTGGLLADAFVSVPGASRVFLGSAVTYHLGAKQHILGVDETLLAAEGAVDPRVASQMASGTARLYSTAVPSSRVVGISTTGVAGPDSDGFKPVGLVYVGVSVPSEVGVDGAGAGSDGNDAGRVTRVRELRLEGNRQEIRRRAVEAAIVFAREMLDSSTTPDDVM